MSLVSSRWLCGDGGVTSLAGHRQHHACPAITPTPPPSGKRRAQTSVYPLYNQVLNRDPIRSSCPVGGSHCLKGSGGDKNACSSAVAGQERWQCSYPQSRFWQMRFCAVPSGRGGFRASSPDSRGSRVQRLRILRRRACARSGSLVYW